MINYFVFTVFICRIKPKYTSQYTQKDCRKTCMYLADCCLPGINFWTNIESVLLNLSASTTGRPWRGLLWTYCRWALCAQWIYQWLICSSFRTRYSINTAGKSMEILALWQAMISIKPLLFAPNFYPCLKDKCPPHDILWKFLLELSHDDLRQIGVEKKQEGDQSSQSKPTEGTVTTGEIAGYF